tara:strand:- start:6405 stop:6851 length:447 start_codon:yes stop_codon:yes gene_type:complete
MTKKTTNSFNDRMVSKTVIPAIYLWLLSCGAVVGMGIWKPNIVLENLDGFIALIAIIGGVAGPALSTVLRMWESEQTVEIDNMGVELEHERSRDEEQHKASMIRGKDEHSHRMFIEKSEQEHIHEVEKHQLNVVRIEPDHKLGDDDFE